MHGATGLKFYYAVADPKVAYKLNNIFIQNYVYAIVFPSYT